MMWLKDGQVCECLCLCIYMVLIICSVAFASGSGLEGGGRCRGKGQVMAHGVVPLFMMFGYLVCHVSL